MLRGGSCLAINPYLIWSGLSFSCIPASSTKVLISQNHNSSMSLNLPPYKVSIHLFYQADSTAMDDLVIQAKESKHNYYECIELLNFINQYSFSILSVTTLYSLLKLKKSPTKCQVLSIFIKVVTWFQKLKSLPPCLRMSYILLPGPTIKHVETRPHPICHWLYHSFLLNITCSPIKWITICALPILA